jgi:hypothetical protein
MFLTGLICYLREVNLDIKETTLAVMFKVVLFQLGQCIRFLACDTLYYDRSLETRHKKLQSTMQQN